MEQIELNSPDRARIDNLTAELRRYNDQFDTDVIVSCTEAARLLRRTTPTISQMLRDGRLHKTTRGNSVGILLSEIRRFQGA